MKSAISVILLLLQTTPSNPAEAEESPLTPLPLDWRDNDGSPVDLSFLLDAPAGRHGPPRVKDGHIVRGDGERLRIWGVNFTAAACFPEKVDAPVVARHLARHGINCVRFHFLDSNWGAQASVFDPGRKDTQALDAGQMDLLDFFVAELKKRGIYSNFNLNVGRVYREEDGVPDYRSIGLAKGIQYYDDHVAKLHEEYAKLLLTHRNPYTEAEYRHEPALVIVELLNENSLVEAWFSGRLRGLHQGKGAGTWSDVTRHYADLLTRKYNAWLAQQLSGEDIEELRREAKVESGQPVPRLDPRQFSEASEMRFHTEARFYMGLENQYFQRMRRTLDALGVKALVAGTSDHNHYKSGYPLLSSASGLDLVDGHVYWQHPKYIRKGGRTTGFWIPNTAMVDDPFSSTVVQLARSAVAGKPYTVSETNHPFPNAFACEGIGILAAYALLQDWDGIFFYTFEHKDPQEWNSRTPGHFDIRADPTKMTDLAAAGVFFHRGDVRSARETIARSYSEGQIIESIRMPSSERPFFTRGFPLALPLIHKIRIESFEKPGGNCPKLELAWPITSDTGELQWRGEGRRGLVSMDTPKTQGVFGHVRGRQLKLKNLVVNCDNEFASLILTSLDGEPLGLSRNMLLAATSRSETTGMQWNEKKTSLLKWGGPPFCVEVVRGKVSLRNRMSGQAPATLAVFPLGSSGKPRGAGAKIALRSGAYEIPLHAPVTWYWLRVGS